MARYWTEAAKVRRKFKAGPPLRKDKVFSPIEAVFQACIMLLNFRVEMHNAGLKNENDCGLYLVMGTLKNGELDAEAKRIHIPKASSISATVKKVESIKGAVALGVVFYQIDRDPKAKEKVATWVQPFKVGPVAEKILKQAEEQVAGER